MSRTSLRSNPVQVMFAARIYFVGRSAERFFGERCLPSRTSPTSPTLAFHPCGIARTEFLRSPVHRGVHFVRSCRQPHVQFIKDGGQPVTEEFVRPAQAADRVERHFFEIVLLDVEAAGDVVLDGVEPPADRRKASPAAACLSAIHCLIPLLDRHADRSQRRVRIDGVAHQGDHVHQLLAAFAPHFFGFDHFVCLPEPAQRFEAIRVDEERRLDSPLPPVP